VETITDTIEETPPELLADIMEEVLVADTYARPPR
jgi:actin-like ATPase involved in cell morphogenesis